MKSFFKYIMIMPVLSSGSLHGAISLNLIFDRVYTATGSEINEGTLWALVSDGGNDGFGGFGLNQSLSTSSAAGAIFTSGQTIDIGSTFGAGNTVFAMGGATPGTGNILNALSGFNGYGSNGVAENVNYALYWFPGALYTGGVSAHTFTSNAQTIGSQVGGIHNSTADVGNGQIYAIGMSLPANGSGTHDGGAASITGGGSLADSRLTAVNLIPEPSAALLGAFGALAMLRRRREA